MTSTHVCMSVAIRICEYFHSFTCRKLHHGWRILLQKSFTSLKAINAFLAASILAAKNALIALYAVYPYYKYGENMTNSGNDKIAMCGK